MKPSAIPPIVAGIVAAVIALTRRLSAVLVSGPNTPPAETMTWYVQGGRFASFVLVYGLVLGLAYRAGTRRRDPGADATLALATGVVGAIGHLVGLAAVLGQTGVGQQGWLAVAALSIGAAVGVGVQLAVVAFAGVSLARRRTSGTDSGDRRASDRTPTARSD